MTKEEKLQIMEALQQDALEFFCNALNEAEEDNGSYNTQKVLQTKFCGVDGVVLFSPAIKDGETQRKLFLFDTVDKDDKEYDVYYMLFNLKTGKISFVKANQAACEKDAKEAAKAAGATINVRDVYAGKDDIKSFFENMNTEVAKIFDAFSNIFGNHEKKEQPKPKEDEKKDDKPETEEKKSDVKKPEKKHADAIHAIVNKIISSNGDAFVNLCRIFAYIEKRGEEDGYDKVIADVRKAISSLEK